MSAENPIIVMTGGGTGGHITPILALAEEVKARNPNATIVYIGEKGGKFDELTSNHPAIDQTFAISAGKLRRYHGQSWLIRIVDVRTNLLNARDFLRFLLGIVQAKRILKSVAPDLVFQKGGFVGVPVSVAASRLKIPIATHDSDIVPGLANRIVGRWATLHATAYPTEFYDYPQESSVYVGVLVEKAYKPVSEGDVREYKLKLALNPDEPVLLITGGSSGAESINKAIVHSVATLLQNLSTLQILHQVGKGKTGVYGNMKHDRLKVVEFMNPMVDYLSAADIVVTRASANTLAELGVLGKASIAVPAGHLADGHQLKNAKLLAEQGSAIVIPEEMLYDKQHGLFAAITSLLVNPKRRKELANTLQRNTKTDAAQQLAEVLLGQIKPAPKDEATKTES